MKSSRLAPRVASLGSLADVSPLVAAYSTEAPDPSGMAQEVPSGTSGSRGSSPKRSFNAAHVLAITQASGLHRTRRSLIGPLVFSIAATALSAPTGATPWESAAAPAAIGAAANALHEAKKQARKRSPCERSLCDLTPPHRRDDLADVVDLELVREAKLRLGIDRHRPANLSFAVPADRTRPGRPTFSVKLRCLLR